jgi:hypothetical protein
MSRTGETMRLVWAIASGIGGTADIAHLGGHVAVLTPNRHRAFRLIVFCREPR